MQENFYILLDLDPLITEEAKINAAIDSKQQKWASDTNHPNSQISITAKQNLAKIPDIRTVMLSKELREKEATSAKEILIAKTHEQNKDLIATGSYLIKNGEILETDLEALLKKSKFKGISKEQALIILKAKIKKVVTEEKDDGIQILDREIIKRIRAALIIVNKKDLFHFLDRAPTSTFAAFLQKADEIYNLSSKNANKTAEVTATDSLTSMCKTYLKDEESKKIYSKSWFFSR